MEVHKLHMEKTDLPSSHPQTRPKKQGSLTPSKLNIVIYDLLPVTIQCYKSSPPCSNTLYKYILALAQ